MVSLICGSACARKLNSSGAQDWAKPNGSKAHRGSMPCGQQQASVGQRKEGYCSCLSQIELKEFPSEVVFHGVHHRWVIGKQITGKSGLPALGQGCSQRVEKGCSHTCLLMQPVVPLSLTATWLEWPWDVNPGYLFCGVFQGFTMKPGHNVHGEEFETADISWSWNWLVQTELGCWKCVQRLMQYSLLLVSGKQTQKKKATKVQPSTKLVFWLKVKVSEVLRKRDHFDQFSEKFLSSWNELRACLDYHFWEGVIEISRFFCLTLGWRYDLVKISDRTSWWR